MHAPPATPLARSADRHLVVGALRLDDELLESRATALRAVGPTEPVEGFDRHFGARQRAPPVAIIGRTPRSLLARADVARAARHGSRRRPRRWRNGSERRPGESRARERAFRLELQIGLGEVLVVWKLRKRGPGDAPTRACPCVRRNARPGARASGPWRHDIVCLAFIFHLASSSSGTSRAFANRAAYLTCPATRSSCGRAAHRIAHLCRSCSHRPTPGVLRGRRSGVSRHDVVPLHPVRISVHACSPGGA